MCKRILKYEFEWTFEQRDPHHRSYSMIDLGCCQERHLVHTHVSALILRYGNSL